MSKERKTKSTGLHKKTAEEVLARGPSSSTLSQQEIEKLVHDLSVHQIELETQNEELRRSQLDLEALREKYVDLYDSAPVGYATIDDRGQVAETNLTLASLLGRDKASLTNRPFTRFVDAASQDTFHLHRSHVFRTRTRHACEIVLKRKDATFPAELQSIVLENGDHVAMRTVVMDITERKQAEDALRQADEKLEAKVAARTAALAESEDRYRMLFEKTEDGVIVTDPLGAGRVLSMNPAASRMLGYTEEEHSRLTRNDIVDSNSPNMDKLLKQREGEGWASDVLTYKRKDGSTFYGEVTSAFFDDRRGVRRAVTVIRDVTGHIRARDALRKVRDEMEARVEERTAELRGQAELMNLTHDAIIARDLEHRIFFWNKGAEELYGWTSQETEGKSIAEVLPTVLPQPWRTIKDQLLLHGRWEGELTHITRDGRKITVASRQALRRDEGGKPTAILEINSDITEHKRADEERQRLAAAVEHTAEGIIIMGADFVIRYVNPATSQITGYSSQELVGKDAALFQTDTAFSEGLRKTVLRGRRWEGIYRFKRKNGTVCPARLTVDPIDDPSGPSAYFVAAAHDITGEQKLEAQLRRAQKMEALGTLAGGIAHDFNNILAAIVGFAELARERLKEGSRERHLLQRIFDAGLRGRTLVKQMLTFSRDTVEEKKILQLSAVVDDTMKLMRASIPSTIAIKSDIRSKWGLVLADPVQMEQVLMNLCTNAAYAMREKGGTLKVGLAEVTLTEGNTNLTDMKPGAYLKLTVSDTGTGMPSDIVDLIFDPFFTTKKPDGGTGLGLSVVHGIVRQHGGSISVDTEPGRGSVFTVYFPRIVEERLDDPNLSGESLPTGNERVLFVDDEEALGEMGQEILEGLGYVVTVKRSSAEALAAVKAIPSAFDLVMTDMTMPDRTGLELTREILALRPDMPVILCTGFSHLVDARQAKAAGVKAFLMKPLTKEEIALTVRRVLDGKVAR